MHSALPEVPTGRGGGLLCLCTVLCSGQATSAGEQSNSATSLQRVMQSRQTQRRSLTGAQNSDSHRGTTPCFKGHLLEVEE